MKCSEYLDIYNASVNIDYVKADMLYKSQFCRFIDRVALKVAARFLACANNRIGRVLERNSGEVEEKAKNNNLD